MSTLIFSVSMILVSVNVSSFVPPKRNSYFSHRDIIVAGTLCGSVVARIKVTKLGGSSRVFNSALKASFVSICTSSIMYTFCLPIEGLYSIFSFNSRISSIPRLEAASISIKSKNFPASNAKHISHSPQGSPFFNLVQLSAFAKIRAVVVLPVPRGPIKRYACPNKPLESSAFNSLVICDCPIS